MPAGVPTDYMSQKTFGVGFGKDGNVDKAIPGYTGFESLQGAVMVPKLDPNYRFQADVTRDFLMCMVAREMPYCSGPTGSGKTSLGEQFCAHTGRPFYRQQFHMEMEPSELVGTWTVVEGGHMVFLESGLVQALRLPSLIVLDEFDSGNPSCTAVIQAVLEGKPMVLSTKGGERVYKHPDCMIMATGNTNGQGDDTGLYTSTTVQSFATMNRFGMFIPINYMPAADETALLEAIFGQKADKPKGSGMPTAEISTIVAVANLIRDAFVSNKLSVVMSTRQTINWTRWYLMTGDRRRAFSLAFSNVLGPADRAVAEELYQRKCGAK